MQALRIFKTYFFRGLAALLPTVLTIWLFIQFYVFLQANVSSHINRGMVRVLVYSMPGYPYVSGEDIEVFLKTKNPLLAEDPNELARQKQDTATVRRVRIARAEEFWVYGQGQVAGFLIAFIAVIFVGAFLASFAGRAIWRMFERALAKAPVFNKIYPHIKQVTDFFLARQKLSFSRVVAVQYPRKGIWSIAMVTGEGLEKVTRENGKDYLTVFVPSSPTPFTGYVVVVPKDETVEMSMTIEEALRFTISGGVIGPQAFKDYSAEKQIDKSEE